MDCTQAQHELLAADDLASGSLSADLADHLKSCAACAEMVARIRSVESAARDLPIVNSPHIRDAFLKSLWRSPATANKKALGLHFNWRAMSAAAVLILAIGSVFWLLRSKESNRPIAADNTVDHLLDWNLKIADADSAETRANLFNAQFTTFKTQIDQIALPADQEQIAVKLLENGSWLSSHPDPLAGAEHFDEVANLVLDQLHAATTKDEPKTVERLSKQYNRLATHGFGPQLKRARTTHLDKPERKKRYDRLLTRREERNLRVQQILEASPNASKKEIRRQLDNFAPIHTRPVDTQP
jgi:hypothetical protein